MIYTAQQRTYRIVQTTNSFYGYALHPKAGRALYKDRGATMMGSRRYTSGLELVRGTIICIAYREKEQIIREPWAKHAEKASASAS